MNAKILKRMRPLFVTAFLHGFVLFYTFEKLFMTNLGFTRAEIGYMVAVYSAVMLIAEVPSGVLADRWSRKGVLMLASISLALSAFVGGTSHSKLQFLISTAFWGIYYAFHSGTYESIVYDTILEESGSVDTYEKLYGRVKMFDSLALVISSLAGGFVGSTWGLRIPYFITVPFSLLAVVSLLWFREPTLHKSKVFVPVLEHIKNTFRAVVRNIEARDVIISLIAINVLLHIMYEFDQLWLIALAVPVAFYGVINALLLSGIGLGGILADKAKLSKAGRQITLFVYMLAGTVVLTLSRSSILTVVALATLSICFIASDIIFSKLLHDTLSSSVRAGAASTVGTISRLIMVPFASLFGYVAGKQNVFVAGWALVVTMGILLVFGVRALSEKTVRSSA